MPPPCLQIYLRPHVTLTFKFLIPKVDCFMPVPRGHHVSIGTKIGSLVFKISCSQVRQQTNERTVWLGGGIIHAGIDYCRASSQSLINALPC